MNYAQDVRIKMFGPALMGLPVVSVSLFAYNHEPYIRNAIESVFSQDFDGPMELVIGEDCSADNTRGIIEDICRKAPIPVCLLTSDRNVGAHANARRVRAKCNGRYVALLDGDDEWLSPNKVKMQVDLLEKEKHASVCFGRCEIRYRAGLKGRFGPSGTIRPIRPAGFLDLKELVDFSDIIPTGSTLYRASMLPPLPDWSDRLPFGDMTMWYLLAQRGPFILVDECLSAYNVGPGVSADFDSVALMIALSELVLRISLTIERNKAKEFLSIVDSRLKHRIYALKESGKTREAARLLSLWVRARARSGFRPGDIERWWLREKFQRATRFMRLNRNNRA